MQTEPLENLTEQSAGVGTWLLSVATVPRSEEYKWSKGNVSGTSKKFECLLVSEDSSLYCMGLFRKRGRDPGATNEFNAAVNKFNKGTTWKVNKITLAKQEPKYLGCSHKVAIDLNLSKFQPVLQSTVKMPTQATPPEDLHTLLKCIPGQIVDVIAFVTNVSERAQRSTSFGARDLVNVTIMDDSGDKNAAKSEFPAWFPRTSSGAPCDDLKRLSAAVEDRVPVAFFNLLCQLEDGKTILKTTREAFAFEIVRSGPKAERLLAKADALLATDASSVTVVTELPAFQAWEAVDYMSREATLTVTRLVHLARQGDLSSAGLSDPVDPSPDGAAEHAVHLFQINHVRVLEPKGLEKVFTNNGERLWPNVRAIDSTGTVELRMRQKAALNLAGLDDAQEFAQLAAKGALNFPILCSIRVTMRRATRADDTGGEEPKQEEPKEPKQTQEYVDIVIVEAASQDLVCPRSLPNASLNYLSELLHMVAPDPTRMIAAPMSLVRRVSHVGMVVDSVQASCVLSLVAHVGRSETVNLDGGHKLISKGCWNVPFLTSQEKDDGAPEHADVKILGEVASYCTMENVQDYTLSTRRATEPMYALIVISGVRQAPEGNNAHVYMVEKVQPVSAADVEKLRPLLALLSGFAVTASSSVATPATPVKWTPDRGLGQAKKARRLGAHPTASPIRSPTA